MKDLKIYMPLATHKLNKISSVDLSSLKDAHLDVKDLLESLGVNIINVSGEEIICQCPFSENHKNADKTPSFSFNTKELIYNCFACGGGTLLTLIKYINGWDDSQTEKWILESTSHVSQDKDLLTEINKRLVKTAAQSNPTYPNSILKNFNVFHSYLSERGLSKEVCREMDIGFDTDHMGITIPHWFNNKLVGWQTRHILQDSDGNFVCDKCLTPRPPKYTNTTGFPKKNTLYGYSKALRYARLTGNKVIVVESPMSVLRLKTYGYNEVVATFGSWSKEQMFSLSGCQQGIILFPDNDPSGYKNVSHVLSFIANLVPVELAPIYDIPKGDPGDLCEEDVAFYLSMCYNPFTFVTEKRLLNLKEAEECHSKNLARQKK